VGGTGEKREGGEDGLRREKEVWERGRRGWGEGMKGDGAGSVKNKEMGGRGGGVVVGRDGRGRDLGEGEDKGEE